MNKIILFTHPDFIKSNSMPRFSKMIINYLEKNNINYEVWSPKSYLHRLGSNSFIAKWLGYIDQYVIFPFWVKKRLKKVSQDTLFVFCDQALGPWVPLVSDRPHVIHCHDLMALKSSLNLVPENRVSLSGKLYQRYIRHGFKKGKNFIPISYKTAEDLKKYGEVETNNIFVIHNGLNYEFKPVPRHIAYSFLKEKNILEVDNRCLLHIGGGQWYKNTAGVVKLYGEYCKKVDEPIQLIMVCPSPKNKTLDAVNRLPANAKISFFQNLSTESIEALYSYADLFLFPSHDEGFGWPIIEAQACGCPVITTNSPPMSEIGGPAVEYIAKLSECNESEWLRIGVEKILLILKEREAEVFSRSEIAIIWSNKFASDAVLKSYYLTYEKIYKYHQISC